VNKCMKINPDLMFLDSTMHFLKKYKTHGTGLFMYLSTSSYIILMDQQLIISSLNDEILPN
jgi:hypothetical protein